MTGRLDGKGQPVSARGENGSANVSGVERLDNHRGMRVQGWRKRLAVQVVSGLTGQNQIHAR
jgi:hypothetical protein